MQEVHCAICNKKEKLSELYPERLSKKNLSSKTYSARRTPDGMHHRFVQCKNCDLIFSNPILPLRQIEKFYKASNFTYTAEIENIKETYFAYFQKAFGGNKKTKVLDIGCGNGFFLEALIDHGYKDVYGVEPSKESVKKARNDIKPRIKVSSLKHGLFKNNFFDVITCYQTLDHITNVNSFLDLVRKLLKRGGKVLFIVHDSQGLSVKLLGEKSPIFDIEHIYLFNQKTLKKLFQKSSFKKISTFQVENKYSLEYWINMLPLPKLLKLIVKNSPFGRLPLTLRAGNIGVTAIN